jgi:hypothetical protein
MSEPTPPPARPGLGARLRVWWPPLAAFLGVLIAVPLLVLGAAYAIAGDDDIYGLAPTQSCLADAEGTRVSDDPGDVSDVLANSARGGALKVWLPSNTLIVSFGDDEQEAERRERSYFRFAGGTIPVRELLMRQGNAVLLWERTPSEEERTLVDGCLS